MSKGVHTEVMALNMIRIGHLVDCTIQREVDEWIVVTRARDGQGGDRTAITDEVGRVKRFFAFQDALQCARASGFEEHLIFKQETHNANRN